MSVKRVTFPHMGEYWIIFETLIELLGAEAVVPPKMTRHTLEAGSQVSPEFVCVPFKYNMGNFLETLEGDVDIIVQAGGGCRFGYYGEVQETILRDMGHDFELVNLVEATNLPMLVRELRRVQPSASYVRVARAFAVAYRQAKAIEAVEDFVRKNVGFEIETGAIDRVVARFLRDLRGARTLRAVRELRASTLAALAAVALDKPENPLRVGVVGELYVLMEPFANHSIERRLAESGVEVHRFITLTTLIDHALGGRKFVRHAIADTGPWVEYHLGADATESVAKTWELMNAGFDGMVHVKPFGCMPEVSAMSQTAEAGVRTRVEAFCDMLEMRKRRQTSA
jgi:predicted nucleotide-binding protein (sugar kinase/HSP70/actin superfamily)